jgi:WD40 repeat protein
MNEQRLERVLRQGPPFATRYVPSLLALDERPVVRGPVSVGRLVLIIAVTVLLLISMLAGLAASGAFRDHDRPVSELGIFEPVAGRIACDKPTIAAGTLLACSRDGTRLLIQKGNENLFVLHADGSETQVTEQLSGFNKILGSSRPSGASISPDGSRVVFAGLKVGWQEGLSCHNGALFAVDADGGPAELLWESQAATNGGIVRYPSFSPDGTQIAFVDGYCDSDHSVWVMNPDGSDAHQIISSDIGPLGGTHVRGLAWSPAGDRIALAVDDATYTFAPDGSGFTKDVGPSEFCWPAVRC